MRQFNIAIVCMLLLGTISLLASCENDRKTQEVISADTAEAKDKIREVQIKRFRERVLSKYTSADPVIFSPRLFEGKRVFTYHLQELIMQPEGKIVLFDGYLDDISKENDKFIIHFSSPLSDDFIDARVVLFRLKSDYEHIKPLIENPPPYDPIEDLILGSLRYYDMADFLVVCSATDIRKIKRYAVNGNSSEGSEDVEIDIKVPDTFLVSGELLELIIYPAEE